jgi:hypothetical protein
MPGAVYHPMLMAFGVLSQGTFFTSSESLQNRTQPIGKSAWHSLRTMPLWDFPARSNVAAIVDVPGAYKCITVSEIAASREDHPLAVT